MSDARYENARAPAERLAAIAAKAARRVRGRSPMAWPDYADFLEALGAHVTRELVEAKLEEARLFGNAKRIRELEREFAFAEAAARLRV